jgi:hypothetical protein
VEWYIPDMTDQDRDWKLALVTTVTKNVVSIKDMEIPE